MNFYISSHAALLGADHQQRIQEVGACFAVPASGVEHAHFFTVGSGENLWPEAFVGPDALKVALREWEYVGRFMYSGSVARPYCGVELIIRQSRKA
jgi:hypothetical protein